ncbi:box C/D snoRNA protein 1-like [Corticium candelabrum]|uniref:box C/D snoRNA protein 1-like n=1 Tax=Corticium candelabrum TaxID=121492 RepID=UPI002E273E12|nr:box C/D snoRNA protein 1-like [Corticium candelabrum]
MSCSVCGKSDVKYRCPGCNRRTCSLQCVRDHKERWSCDGRRNKTKYISIGKYSDKELLSDYRFLEETSRLADRASRDNRSFKAEQRWRRRQPAKLSLLERQARRQSILLQRLPKEFSKRQANTSFYVYKTKSILWRIEWKFPHMNVSFVDGRLSEKCVLGQALGKYIDPKHGDPLIRHRLKLYSQPNEVCVVMRVERCSVDQARYHLLDKTATINSNLQHKCIVEFPTFVVLLPSEFAAYPLITQPDRKIESDSESSSSSEDNNDVHQSDKTATFCTDLPDEKSSAGGLVNTHET